MTREFFPGHSCIGVERLKRWPACISGDSFRFLHHMPVGTMGQLAERGTIYP
jgi:hypothetical protein